GPEVMPSGSVRTGRRYSVMTPPVVIRPILLAASSVNHRLPSGPEVMPCGMLATVGTGYSVIRGVAWAGAAAISTRTPTDRTIPTLRRNLILFAPHPAVAWTLTVSPDRMPHKAGWPAQPLPRPRPPKMN